jgi:hypothetical protein
MRIWQKALVFLIVNVGIQVPPILWVYSRTHGTPNFSHFWDYVSCSLLVGLSFGMLIATVCDSITDRCNVSGGYRFAQFCLTGIGLAVLCFVLDLEFVEEIKHNEALLTLSGVVAAFMVAMGTAVKIEIWRSH